MLDSVRCKNNCENNKNRRRKCVNVNAGCSATNFVINWSSCHCHLTPIQTGTLQLQHHHQSRTSLFEFLWIVCYHQIKMQTFCKFSHLGKAKPLKAISLGVLEFRPIRDPLCLAFIYAPSQFWSWHPKTSNNFENPIFVSKLSTQVKLKKRDQSQKEAMLNWAFYVCTV